MAKPLISYPKDKYSSALQYVLDSTRILPIKSNPADKDSDRNGLPDNITKNGVRWTDSYEQYLNIKDPNPLKADPVWQWPAYYEDGKPINRLQSSFGETGSSSGKWSSAHYAVDITPTKGDKEKNCTVRVSYDGIIKKMVPKDSMAGNYIVIEHFVNGSKIESKYLHLESFNEELHQKFSEAQKVGRNIAVKKGDILGIAGNTGNSERTHLDFSIRLYTDSTSSKIIDPLFNKTSPGSKEIGMYMKVPKNLEPTCSARCTSCWNYFFETNGVKDTYRLACENWGE